MSRIITLGQERGGAQPVGQEQEEAVRRILKDMDPLLDIRWMPHAVIRDGAWEGRYALLCKWPQQDKRWELHRAGDIGEPYDRLGWFVEPDEWGELHDGTRLPVEPMAIMDRVVELLGKCDNSRQPWRDRMKKSVEHNASLRRARQKEAQEEMIDGFVHYRKKLAGEPTVPGADIDAGTGLIITTPKE